MSESCARRFESESSAPDNTCYTSATRRLRLLSHMSKHNRQLTLERPRLRLPDPLAEGAGQGTEKDGDGLGGRGGKRKGGATGLDCERGVGGCMALHACLCVP